MNSSEENILNNEENISDDLSYEESLSDDDYQDHNENLDLEGKILSNYNILNKLGSGTYSIVWLGYNISNEQFYAIKVQHPDEYKEGINEINFMKRLPKNQHFNNLIDSFTQIYENKKYLCSVYNLHSCNLDCLIRKGNYEDGIPYDQSIKIIKELVSSLYYLHKRLKVSHSDFKTDNILIKGVTKLNKFLIDLYKQEIFLEKYKKGKIDYCQNTKKKLDNLTPKEKKKIRYEIHNQIYENIIEKYNECSIDKYELDYTELSISLSDFGAFLENEEHYETEFGTRYYRSPENILIGNSSYPNDIWALGCTIYEIFTGKILFNPDKDINYDRDFHHLKLINELCGEFPKEFLKKTQKYKTFYDNKYKLKINKELNYTNIIDINLANKVPHELINLIKKMLIIDPTKRINITDILYELKKY